METKTTLPISEGRKQIFKIAEEVQKPSTYYTLTEKGKPKVVVISAEEFESWQETLEVKGEFPSLKDDVKKIDEAVKSGEHKKWATLDDVMATYGYVATNKTSKKNGLGLKDR
jgi:prevent-host-death family protein